MKINNYQYLYLLCCLVLLSGCGINSDIMFRGKGVEVIRDNIPLYADEAYVLAPDDRFYFSLFVNDGKRQLDMRAGVEMGVTPDGAQGMMQGNQMMMMARGGMGLDYLINPDGYVQLPILGKVNLTGLTIEQAQDTLAYMYSVEYNKPFVQLEVTNRRAVVFTGGGGRASVVPILNNNTTLMEALALAGGVDTRGRVKKIKIMRRTSEGRVIYELDMSTLAGLKYADMIVQANDYIYVQPVPYIGRELLAEVSAITSLLTSSIFLYSLISND